MSLSRLRLAAFLSFCGLAVWGQPAQPAFEVTSVKAFAFTLPRPGQGPGPEPLFGPTCPSNGHFSARTMLLPVILWAYDIRFPYQIAEVPEWARQSSSAWSIEATSSQQVTANQCRVMARGLLADRFKVTARWEKRDIPVQALIVSKGGPKIHEVTGESGAGVKVNGFLLKPGNPTGLSMEDFVMFMNIGVAVRGEHPIVNRTGLEGVYEFDLKFNQFSQLPNMPNRQNLPDLPAAVQEQLGLKLEERKEPMDVLVIDHVEKPSPN